MFPEFTRGNGDVTPLTPQEYIARWARQGYLCSTEEEARDLLVKNGHLFIDEAGVPQWVEGFREAPLKGLHVVIVA